jgi:GntR family transcriptional regulator, transcriptional repressor for pyruvate dehydrogenase complex
MPLKSIPTTRLADLVNDQLKQSIFNGKYKEGEKLPSEHELTEILGVSRVVVREAIRNLEKAGLIEIKRGATGGSFVRAIKHNAISNLVRDSLGLRRTSVAEIMEVRLHMEPIVAGLAAERRDLKDIKSLEKNIENIPKVKSGAKYLIWNVDFHRLVAKASHNFMYELLINILMDITQDLILSIKPHGRIVHDTATHRAIVEKIKQGDIEGTKRTVRKHLKDIFPLLEGLQNELPVQQKVPIVALSKPGS